MQRRKEKSYGIRLNLDISKFQYTKPLPKAIIPGTDDGYQTSIILIVPLEDHEFKSGVYQVPFRDSTVTVILGKIDRENDLILKYGKDFHFGTPGTGVPELPFMVFTDNRGKYPAITAEIGFPYRVASWIDSTHESGLKMDNDYEKMQIVGSPPDQDKLDALMVLNRLFKQPEYPFNVPAITYDDVTVFLELYRSIRTNKTLLYRLVALDGHDAYKEAILDFFLGENRPENIVAKEFVEKAPKIKNENDLVAAVIQVLNDVVKHHVENRYWIQPFWDDPGSIRVNGRKRKIRPKPKKEIKITPTFHVLLQEFLSPFGIHVERESDSGVGSLDFKCMHTTETGAPICIIIEVKLAHGVGLRKGLTRQLPAYLLANKSKTGIYLVVWFKGRHFNEPRVREKSEMESWLQKTANDVRLEQGINIIPLMIDASVRPTASKL